MPTPAEQRVIGLLRTLRLAAEAWDERSHGGGPRLMPSLWHEGSYAELERVLHVMRDGDPRARQLWWHVNARYVWNDERVARVECRRTRQGPVVIAPECSEVAVVLELHSRYAHVRLREWSPAVVETLVAAGVRELATRMYRGDHGRVVLPRELIAVA